MIYSFGGAYETFRSTHRALHPFRNYLYEVEVFRIIIIFHESILCYSVKVYVKGKISIVVQFEIKILFGVL